MMSDENETKAQRSTKSKGDVVQDIVAMMHSAEDVTVQTGVFLPTPSAGNREIDVLVTGYFIHYPVRIAFECKNYDENDPIEAADIGIFIDKLNQVGIPPQHGIFVSTSPFRSGAKNRAREVGMKVLNLDGLTPDRLNAEISNVVQSIVFYRATVHSVAFPDGVPFEKLLGHAYHTYEYCDALGRVVSTMPIEVWRKWFNGEIPLRMGFHLIDLVVPPGTYIPVTPALRVPAVRLLVSLRVDGLVLSVAGESRQHQLVNALDDSVERQHVSATFAPPEGQHTLRVFDGEEALAEYVVTTPTPRITSRVRIPRIVLGAAYWPLSPQDSIRTCHRSTLRLWRERTSLELGNLSCLVDHRLE
jgi:hypothetical protein